MASQIAQAQPIRDTAVAHSDIRPGVIAHIEVVKEAVRIGCNPGNTHRVSHPLLRVGEFVAILRRVISAIGVTHRGPGMWRKR